ncbi:hypothetical protein ACNPG9_17875 [Klebsiella pneumoniae]
MLIANGQQTADLLRHLADNEIDSDYFAVVSECESYGKETDAELSITEFALRAAGYVDALVEALASEKRICATWRKTAEANSEKLEKAQQRIGKLEKKLTDHKRMNQEMAKAMLTPNDSDAAGMEIAALRQRIAGLESRTVTVKLTDINEYLAEVHDKTLNRAFRLLAEGVRAGDVAAMRAAGIKVEVE